MRERRNGNRLSSMIWTACSNCRNLRSQHPGRSLSSYSARSNGTSDEIGSAFRKQCVGRNRFIAPSSNGGLPAMIGKRRNKAIAPYTLAEILRLQLDRLAMGVRSAARSHAPDSAASCRLFRRTAQGTEREVYLFAGI